MANQKQQENILLTAVHGGGPPFWLVGIFLPGFFLRQNFFKFLAIDTQNCIMMLWFLLNRWIRSDSKGIKSLNGTNKKKWSRVSGSPFIPYPLQMKTNLLQQRQRLKEAASSGASSSQNPHLLTAGFVSDEAKGQLPFGRTTPYRYVAVPSLWTCMFYFTSKKLRRTNRSSKDGKLPWVFRGCWRALRVDLMYIVRGIMFSPLHGQTALCRSSSEYGFMVYGMRDIYVHTGFCRLALRRLASLKSSSKTGTRSLCPQTGQSRRTDSSPCPSHCHWKMSQTWIVARAKPSIICLHRLRLRRFHMPSDRVRRISTPHKALIHSRGHWLITTTSLSVVSTPITIRIELPLQRRAIIPWVMMSITPLPFLPLI